AAAEATRARERAETDRRETAAQAERVRAELAALAGRHDTLGAELTAAREAATAAEGRLDALTVRLRAAETDRDEAHRRVAQLAEQVSHLAAALAHLGPRDTPPPA
ncbi:hypothetical protein ACWENR_30880, partial [Micromonospora sp. NPDC004336]